MPRIWCFVMVGYTRYGGSQGVFVVDVPPERAVPWTHIFEEDIFVLRCMITDVNKDQKQSGVLQQLSMNNTTMTHGNHIHQTRICTLLTDWVKLWADGLGGLQTTVGS